MHSGFYVSTEIPILQLWFVTLVCCRCLGIPTYAFVCAQKVHYWITHRNMSKWYILEVDAALSEIITFLANDGKNVFVPNDREFWILFWVVLESAMKDFGRIHRFSAIFLSSSYRESAQNLLANGCVVISIHQRHAHLNSFGRFCIFCCFYFYHLFFWHRTLEFGGKQARVAFCYLYIHSDNTYVMSCWFIEMCTRALFEWMYVCLLISWNFD